MRRAVVPFVLILVPLSARAEPIPAVDVDRACLTAGTARADCVRRQQFFYDETSLLWDGLSPAGQRYCIEKAEDTRQRLPRGYYEALNSFVRLRAHLEQRDRDRVAPPRFQLR